MAFITIHDFNENKFNTGGLTGFITPTSFKITDGLNKLPVVDVSFRWNKALDIFQGSKILGYGDLGFQIDTITYDEDTKEVSLTGTHVASIASARVCSGIEVFGETVYNILKLIVAEQDMRDYGEDTRRIGLIEPKDLPGNMQWVLKPIDFESKATNIGSIIDKLQSLTGGEIYYEGYKIAIVERIGLPKGFTFTSGINCKNVKIQIDNTKIITRQFPLGDSGLDITSVTLNEEAFLESYNRGLYGVLEEYVDYSVNSTSKYGGPSMLYSEALLNFERPIIEINDSYSEENKHLLIEPERKADTPEISISLEPMGESIRRISLDGDIRVGDTIKFMSISTQTKAIRVESVRVVSKTYDLINPLNTTLELANPVFSPSSALGHAISDISELNKMINFDNKLRADCLELSYGMSLVRVENERAQIDTKVKVNNCSTAQMIQRWHKRLILDAGFIAVGGYDSLAGKWIYSILSSEGNLVLGDGTKGSLDTSKVEIKSPDGLFSISNNLLTVKNIRGLDAIRLGLGLDNKAILNFYSDEGIELLGYKEGELWVNGNVYGRFIGATKAQLEAMTPLDYIIIDPTSQKWITRDRYGQEHIKEEKFIYYGEVVHLIGVGNGIVAERRFGRVIYEDQLVITKQAKSYSMTLKTSTPLEDTTLTLTDRDIKFRCQRLDREYSLVEIINALKKGGLLE